MHLQYAAIGVAILLILVIAWNASLRSQARSVRTEYYMPDSRYRPPVVKGDLPRRYFPRRPFRLTPKPAIRHVVPMFPGRNPLDVAAYPFPHGDRQPRHHAAVPFAPARR